MNRTILLAQLSRAVAAPPNMEELLKYVLNLLIDAFGYEFAAVYLTDEIISPSVLVEDGFVAKLSQFAQSSETTNPFELAEKTIRFHPSQPGKSLIARAITTKRPHIGRAQLSSASKLTEDLTQAAIPITVSKRTFGALTVVLKNNNQQTDQTKPGFSSAQMAELQLLTNLLGLGLERLLSKQDVKQGALLGPFEETAIGPAKYQPAEMVPGFKPDTPRQLAELRALWNISQAISQGTEIFSIYKMIHNQIIKVIGDFSTFAIALYDANSQHIHITYMVEEGKQIHVPPFPLGEGLSSIVIHSRNPLLLVEDTENKARTLGAKVVGPPARSWLGVPMMVAGEPYGVITAQDIHREHQFSEEDQRFLSMVASQVAIVIRNARLLETSRQQVEFEKLLKRINQKINYATDYETILKTTVEELGAALNARRAQIKIDFPAMDENAAMRESG